MWTCFGASISVDGDRRRYGLPDPDAVLICTASGKDEGLTVDRGPAAGPSFTAG
jgi:hypothetical protein